MRLGIPTILIISSLLIFLLELMMPIYSHFPSFCIGAKILFVVSISITFSALAFSFPKTDNTILPCVLKIVLFSCSSTFPNSDTELFERNVLSIVVQILLIVCLLPLLLSRNITEPIFSISSNSWQHL